MALKTLCLLNPRHKKRRPRTSFFVEVVGRGNLNRSFNLLIIKDYLRFDFLLEYLLEYQLRMSLDSRLYLDKCPIP